MSNTSLLLFFSLLPIILILVVIYNIDKNKEPLILLLVCFILGIFLCFAVEEISKVIGNYLPFMNKLTKDLNLFEIFLYSFIGIALIEELCKWIILFSIGYNNKAFDEIYDVIVYSVFVSLGFAFFENIIYVFNLGEVKVAILRALLAIPAHACYAIFMGYYLSKAKQKQIERKKIQEIKYILLSLFIPITIHGIYDFCLMSKVAILIEVFIIFIILLDIVSIKKIKDMVSNNNKLDLS